MTRLLLLILTLWLTGCVATQTQPPISPIISSNIPDIMLDNQWRLTELIYNGTSQEFGAIDPVLITFQPGWMVFQACNSGGYAFDTTGNEYTLTPGAGTARQCDDGGTEQEGVFLNTIQEASRYEIIDDTLTFSGDNAKLVFVLDNEAKKPLDR